MNQTLSPRESLLKAFETLDSTYFSDAFSTQYRYDCDFFHPETMIFHLKNMFDEFKELGNTSLLPENGICTNDCTGNKGCGGYIFKGNHSKHYCSFVIKMHGNAIRDFISCGGMRFEGEEGFERLQTEMFYGEADWPRLPLDTVDKIKGCYSAIDDLKALAGKTTIEALQDWLQAYEGLADEIDVFNLFMPPINDTFYCSYDRVSDVVGLAVENSELKGALEDWRALDCENNKAAYSEWYSKHHDLVWRSRFLERAMLTDNCIQFEFVDGYPSEVFVESMQAIKDLLAIREYTESNPLE